MKNLTAHDIMTTDVLTVHEQMSAAEAARFLTENEISGAPVLSGEGTVIGVISLSDLARAVGNGGDAMDDTNHPEYYMVGRVEEHDVRGWGNRLAPEDIEQLHIESETASVTSFMTPRALTVDPSATVAELARMMVAGHYHRVLVTEGQKLTGIVSSMDLLKLLALP